MNVLTTLLVIGGIVLAALGIYWYRAQRALRQAKARASGLNRELERPDSQLEMVEVWSEEQFERKNRQRANAILEKVGTELSTDESVEAKRLLAFLDKIHTANTNPQVKTPTDIGRAWFACLQLQDNDPEAEVAQLFKVLNDAWTTRDNQAQLSAVIQTPNFKTITSNLRIQILKTE